LQTKLLFLLCAPVTELHLLSSRLSLQQGHSAQTVLKDLDLRQRFKLDQGSARRVHEQLDVDTRLLSTLRVMDYSMLLGVHQVAAAAASSEGRQVRSQPNFAEHSNTPGGSLYGILQRQSPVQT
jgi:hypothetical protein